MSQNIGSIVIIKYININWANFRLYQILVSLFSHLIIITKAKER